jgi:hypothetical protein
VWLVRICDCAHRQACYTRQHNVLYVVSYCVAQTYCQDGVATGCTIQGSHPVRGKRSIPSPETPDQFWGPPTLLFNGYRGSFPGVKRPGRDVDHLHLTPKLTMSRAVTLLLVYAFIVWPEESYRDMLWKHFNVYSTCDKEV